MSAHDRLSEQLRASVRERGRARRRARRGLLMALAGVVVIGGGVATAATGVLPVTGRGHDDDGGGTVRELASRAVRATRGAPACATTDPNAPVRAVRVEPARAALPLLAGSPPDAAAQRALLARHYVGAVVDGSVRRVALPGGKRVLVFLAVGAGGLSLRDPGACLSARLAWLAAHAAGERRERAAAVVHGYRDTIPGLQSLNIITLRPAPPGAIAGGGTGIPLDGRPLPTGVVASSSDGVYTGIAVPGARIVTVDGRRGLHRAVAVRSRIFVVGLPRRGTGPVRLRQRGADGRVLAAQTVRG